MMWLIVLSPLQVSQVKERDALRLQEDEQRLETHRMAQQSYQDKY